MIRIPALLGACLAAAIATAARADEVRLVDGRVFIGSVKVDGDEVRVRTKDGENLRFKADDVVRIRTDQELRDELLRLQDSYGGAPHAHLELARLARAYGLDAEMWKHLDACVTAGDSGPTERLDRFLATLAGDLVPEHRLRADTARKVRALLDRVRDGASPGRTAAVEVVLAGLQDEDADEQLRIRARGASSPLQRATALRALGRRGASNEAFVWRTAVIDSTPAVRDEAMRIAREAGRADDATAYLAPGLMQPDGRIRVRTAQAFAALGSPGAVAPLVAAAPFAGAAALSPGATRAHVAFLSQQAYVQDFDVEVAMASFIADPRINVVQSGVVLDVTVAAITSMRVEIVRAYRDALKRLTGDDPGADVAAWDAWLDGRPEAKVALPERPAPAPGPAGPGPRGPVGAGPVPKGGKAGGGAAGAADPDGGIRIGGTPILPGTLPPLPGSSFPPAPPPVQRPTPVAPPPLPGRR